MPKARGRALARSGPFPPSARVRRRVEYQQIQARGIRVHSAAFTVVAQARAPGAMSARVGCAVSRKVGGAVVRNRIRRLVKELFRRARSELPAVDLVVIAKPAAAVVAGGSLTELVDTLLPLLFEAAARAGGRR